MNKNTHKVTLMQGGVSVTFNLNDREYELLQKSQYQKGSLYNFAAYTWADYDLSPYKRGRFHKYFNYHNGDFFWFNGTWED